VKTAAASALALTLAAACSDPREPPRTGLMEEPVACLDQDRICSGMKGSAIDDWIKSGGAVQVESAYCEPQTYERHRFSDIAAVMAWCPGEAHVHVAGRHVDYAFAISGGVISTIKIERRGTFP
jgi:hypothetical protein